MADASTTLPSSNTGGIDINSIMQQAGLDSVDSTTGAVKPSLNTSSTVSGPSMPDAAQRLIDIGTNMANAVAANQAKVASTQAAQTALVKQQQAQLNSAAATQTAAGTAAGSISGQATTAAYQTQQKLQGIAGAEGFDPTDANSTLRKSIDDIQVATQRYNALNYATEQVKENQNLANVVFGDTTFEQFLDANFRNTPEVYEGRAKVQAGIIASNATQMNDLQNIFNGQAEVTKATEDKLTANSASQAATVGASQYQRAAAELSDKAMAAGTQNTQSVIQAAEHNQNISTSEGMVQGRLIADSTSLARLDISQADKDPEGFAANARLGAQFLNIPALQQLQGKDVASYTKTPQGKQAVAAAAYIGAAIRSQHTLNPTAPLPQIFPSVGAAADILTTLNAGGLPQGMGRVSRFISDMSAGTDFYPMGNPKAGQPIKGVDKIAVVNANVARYYQTSANNVDATDEYGKPPLKTIVQMASMNTDPAVALFTNQILKPISLGLDTVPADMIMKAALTSTLPLNTLVAGVVSYAKSVQALDDTNNNYQVIGAKPAKDIPYTAALTLPGTVFGATRHVDLGNEAQVRDFITRAKFGNINHGLGNYNRVIPTN
jgi:hypothetical protein